MLSNRAMNDNDPHGRPTLVCLRTLMLSTSSSSCSHSLQSLTTPAGGKSFARSGSASNPQCPLALDHLYSSARRTSLALTAFLDTEPLRELAQQFQVRRAALVVVEDRRAPIPTLRHVVGQA